MKMAARKMILALACILICFAATGCYSSSPQAIAKRDAINTQTRTKAVAKWKEKTSTLKAGSTLNDTQKVFDSKGTHQFTILKDSRKYTCLSFDVGTDYSWIGIGTPYYAIFGNNGLYSIVEPSPFEYETRIDKKGRRISHRKAVAPEKRLETVFAANKLFSNDLGDSIQQLFPRRHSTSNLGPILPLMYGLAPISLIGNAPGKFFHDMKINKLKRKYDPEKISIGMSPDEVKTVLGKPNSTYHPSKDRTILVYGSQETYKNCPQHRFTWMSLEFKKTLLTSIYTNDFFNDELMRKK
jgi:hypothetical protein